MQLPLEISNEVKIRSNFVIPFFNKNKIFNSQFINTYVQQLGYSIINEIRVFVKEDERHSIERSSEVAFDLDVNYVIKKFSDTFLSILITSSDYFWSAHPNHHVYTLNFAFNPDRKLSLVDIIDYSSYYNLRGLLKSAIEKYSDEECKHILMEHLTDNYIYNLDFTIEESTFTIYLTNLLPHAFKGCGYLEIPIEEMKFKF